VLEPWCQLVVVGSVSVEVACCCKDTANARFMDSVVVKVKSGITVFGKLITVVSLGPPATSDKLHIIQTQAARTVTPSTPVRAASWKRRPRYKIWHKYPCTLCFQSLVAPNAGCPVHHRGGGLPGPGTSESASSLAMVPRHSRLTWHGILPMSLRMHMRGPICRRGGSGMRLGIMNYYMSL